MTVRDRFISRGNDGARVLGATFVHVFIEREN